MRTRRGLCYPWPQGEAQWRPAEDKDGEESKMRARRRRRRPAEDKDGQESRMRAKRRRRRLPAGGEAAEVWPNTSAQPEDFGGERPDLFDVLPDDLVVNILCKLSASASSPSDLASVIVICKRFNRLGSSPWVVSKASVKSLAVRAKNWSESSHRFLKRCADAGNLDACYILGMILFYCVQSRRSGASLLARAALGSHASALYSLAVIQFNGSGGSKGDKDLRAGVALCARAAFLGHVDALRELGHCFQDGYGVRRNIAEGRRFLVQANARELAAVMKASRAQQALMNHHCRNARTSGCSLLSDYGYSVPASEAHPVNRFLTEWFAARGVAGGSGEEGLRLCSHGGCGRPETRRHEFRRCSVCGAANYCSRACQALHWKVAHKVECATMERWLEAAIADAAPPQAAAGEAAMP